ncbi:MAG: hypothetical protein ACQEQU_05140 [Spirochaetota bacterium]
MKKLGIIFLLVVILISPVAASGEAGDISVGLALGQPSGLTGKFMMDDKLSTNVLTAFRFGSSTTSGAMLVRAAVSFDVADVAIENADFYPYVGGGIDVMMGDTFGLGVVAPLGISYYFDDPPIEVYAEVVPGLSFTSGTDPFYVGGGIGGRYSLNR